LEPQLQHTLNVLVKRIHEHDPAFAHQRKSASDSLQARLAHVLSKQHAHHNAAAQKPIKPVQHPFSTQALAALLDAKYEAEIAELEAKRDVANGVYAATAQRLKKAIDANKHHLSAKI
jgi:hypothetical protein